MRAMLQATCLGTLVTAVRHTGLAMQDAADWYEFRVTSTPGSGAHVSVDFLRSQGDLVVELFTPAGVLVHSSSSTRAGERISLEGLDAGRYLVKVYGLAGAHNPNYSLSIDPAQFQGRSGSNLVDEHLLDTYIRAEESEKVSAFDDMTLVELIVERGEEALDELPTGLKQSQEAIAETIENNVRKVIIDEMAVNPKYYERMSHLLDEIILARRKKADDYKAYLAKIVELTRQVKKPETQTSYPAEINTAAKRALYDNLEKDEATEVQLDKAIRHIKKADWRGNKFKEREVKGAIKSVLGNDEELVENIFEIVKAQRDY